MKPKAFIVYCSPAGTTRHVAVVIEKKLKQLGADVQTLDLKDQQEHAKFHQQITSADEKACLFVGSPVYRGVAVPPVMAFIQALGQNNRHVAVPFATWGGSSSGIALWQMGKALQDKSFDLAGGAKVFAFHSMMFAEKDPLGQGRPNLKDDKIIKEMAVRISRGLDDDTISHLPLEALDYQPEAMALRKKNALNQPWKITSRIVHEIKCTQCGICRDECPSSAIDMAPFPQFGSSCIDCLNCQRFCPEKAIELTEDMSRRIEQIKIRSKTGNEKPITQVFIP